MQDMTDFWAGVEWIYNEGRPMWLTRDGRLITQAQMEQRERLFRAGHDPDADYVPYINGKDATLGPIVAMQRTMRNMSQRDLALVAGVSQSMVARLERGMREPSWRTFRLLLEAMRLVQVLDVRELDDQTTAPSSSSSESVGGT